MKRRFVLAGLIIAWFVTGAFGPLDPTNPPVNPKDNVVSLNDSPPAALWCNTQFPPGFMVQTRATGTALYHTTAGKIVVTQARARITWTNLNNGKSVWTPSVGNWTLVPDPYGNLVVAYSSGVLQRIVIPGEGLVSADVGRIDVTISATPGHGSSMSYDKGLSLLSQYDAICEGLH